MIPKKRIPTHPGEILLKHFLRPLKITQSQLAEHLGISVQRVNELVKGKRGITPNTAWLLSQAFGNSAQFWINLQTTYDLAKHRPTRKIRPIKTTAA